MIKDLPHFVPQKVCLSCDGCCRFAEVNSSWRPRMAREEIENRRSFAKILLKELDEDNAIKAVECRGQSQCVFFNADENTCQVYEERPFECRLYPFLLVKKGDDLSVGVRLSCPYIQEKRHDIEFKNYVESLQQYFQQQEVLEFARRNNALFGDYPECEQEIEHLFELPE